MSERPGISIDLDDSNDDEIDISSLTGLKNPKPKINRKDLNKASEEAGFVSRQAPKHRRRGGRTAYTRQKNFKMRPDMPELFADVADGLGVKDYELLEMAIQAFLTKQKMKEELERFKSIIE